MHVIPSGLLCKILVSFCCYACIFDLLQAGYFEFSDRDDLLYVGAIET